MTVKQNYLLSLRCSSKPGIGKKPLFMDRRVSVFIIAHPLSSMDKLENNCYIKKAENMLSFKNSAFTCRNIAL